jgi:hypothetical protein
MLDKPSCGEDLIKNEKVLSTIRKYLTVRTEEKNLFGEVFTPIELICEMLDHLPDEVWKDPNLKWLDPANGIGNFPVIVYYRLMEGLQGKIKSPTFRSKHIIENMLYMVELNPVNVRLCRKIFGMIDHNSKPNIVGANFLEEQDKWQKTFKSDKFNIIIGNPPFQKSQEQKRKGGYGGRTLWDKFIKNSLSLLVDKGFLCFINPQQWRKPDHEMFNIMIKLQIIYLKILGLNDVKKWFNVGQKVDLYILQNTPYSRNTNVIDELDIKHTINFNKWPFIPNHSYKLFSKILTMSGIDIIYSRSLYGNDKKNMKNKKTKSFLYPVIRTINEKGPVIWYSNIQHGHYGVSKVIGGMGNKPFPINDYGGKYGMAELCYGIPIKSKKEGDLIIGAINSKSFNEIIKAAKWQTFQTDWRMFKYLKKDFYKYFLKEDEPLPVLVEKGQLRKKKTKRKHRGRGNKTIRGRRVKTRKRSRRR